MCVCVWGGGAGSDRTSHVISYKSTAMKCQGLFTLKKKRKKIWSLFLGFKGIQLLFIIMFKGMVSVPGVQRDMTAVLQVQRNVVSCSWNSKGYGCCLTDSKGCGLCF